MCKIDDKLVGLTQLNLKRFIFDCRTLFNLKSRNQRQFIKVVEHQLNATHLSPRWGFMWSLELR